MYSSSQDDDVRAHHEASFLDARQHLLHRRARPKKESQPAAEPSHLRIEIVPRDIRRKMARAAAAEPVDVGSLHGAAAGEALLRGEAKKPQVKERPLRPLLQRTGENAGVQEREVPGQPSTARVVGHEPMQQGSAEEVTSAEEEDSDGLEEAAEEVLGVGLPRRAVLTEDFTFAARVAHESLKV
mmetsp:Transcript_7070/g.17083  ORF Transcript_7070/g.17083 Transcript_7070/m.17083 type:complete len:184 (+) Transcript_7070:138-689(+)